MQKVRHYNERKKWQITISEEQAIIENTNIHNLVCKQIDKGYEIVYEYHHEAVGKVVILEPIRPEPRDYPDEPCYE